ncbi:MAG TPA: septation protein SepH, partial [Gordonia sp. (in: high G+C Gram-positive bacteria)]|nr:septation protein SepH [Gordonia sp. (in: high G+C Gram-positive bacteria)]
MRELRVVGVDTDGKRVICQDPDTTERFAIVADERLRAAARGDLSRLGQIQIEMESSLRPREIQA